MNNSSTELQVIVKAKELAKQAVLDAYDGYYVSKIDAEPEKLYIT